MKLGGELGGELRDETWEIEVENLEMKTNKDEQRRTKTNKDEQSSNAMF